MGYKRVLNRMLLEDDERHLFALVPLVFGLMPRAVFTQRSPYEPLTPHIERHLSHLGLPRDEDLTAILREIGRQYAQTNRGRNLVTGARKYGMSDLRSRRTKYVEIRTRQHERCSTCGILLTGTEETLDHVVPWRLVGDIPDGSNWQILCRPCNSGKGSTISYLQVAAEMNWIYGMTPVPTGALIAAEIRYVTLKRFRKCGVPDCQAGPTERELRVVRRAGDGLLVPDHLAVVCEGHAPA
jgi:hypothetical protein